MSATHDVTTVKRPWVPPGVARNADNSLATDAEVDVHILTPLAESGPAGRSTVFMLHGLGSEGAKWVARVQEFFAPSLPHTTFIMPDAARLPLTSEGCRLPGVRGWVDFAGCDDRDDEPFKGATASRDFIRALVQEQLDAGVDPRRIILCGFSQGAACSLYTGLQLPMAIGGVIAMCGYLPRAREVARDVSPQALSTPFLILSGDADDNVLPLDSRRSHERIAAMGVKDLNFHMLPGLGHRHHKEYIDLARERMKAILSKPLVGPAVTGAVDVLTVVFLNGPLGVGKSTTAEAIVDSLADFVRSRARSEEPSTGLDSNGVYIDADELAVVGGLSFRDPSHHDYMAGALAALVRYHGVPRSVAQMDASAPSGGDAVGAGAGGGAASSAADGPSLATPALKRATVAACGVVVVPYVFEREDTLKHTMMTLCDLSGQRVPASSGSRRAAGSDDVSICFPRVECQSYCLAAPGAVVRARIQRRGREREIEWEEVRGPELAAILARVYASGFCVGERVDTTRWRASGERGAKAVAARVLHQADAVARGVRGVYAPSLIAGAWPEEAHTGDEAPATSTEGGGGDAASDETPAAEAVGVAERLPRLDFAREFIEPVLRGAKRATARFPKEDIADDEDPSDLEEILRLCDEAASSSPVSAVQVVATCAADGVAFGTLLVSRVSRVRFDAISDAMAATEGYRTGDELRTVLRRFYPMIDDADEVALLEFTCPHLHPTRPLA